MVADGRNTSHCAVAWLRGLQELERRLNELTANIAAEQRSSDQAWEQTMALAAAFDTGAALPPVEELPALKPTASRVSVRGSGGSRAAGASAPADRVGAGGGVAPAGSERGAPRASPSASPKAERKASPPPAAPAAGVDDSGSQPARPQPGDTRGSGKLRPSSRSSSRGSRRNKMSVDVNAAQGRQSPFGRPTPGNGGASAMSFQSRGGAATPESEASALDYRAGPIEPPSMLS